MSDHLKTVAVSNPGGAPRQFRVQYRDETNGIWKHCGVFQSRGEAERYMNQLKPAGVATRLIHFRIPSAA
ncbi:MAG: hypothetical protein ACR2NP_11475 [Pirellulaceae bacterium]